MYNIKSNEEKMSKMYHQWQFIFNVIFVLSTIIVKIDCCSSRMLLLKEHATKSFEEETTTQSIDQSNNNAFVFQSQIDKYLQHIQAFINSIAINPNKTSQIPQTNQNEFRINSNTNNENNANINENENVWKSKHDDDDVATDTVIRDKNVNNFNLHMNDIYYTIMKDVLTFACTDQFLTDFCLNNGRCFRYPVGNQSFFSCECADGYVGERCESKSVRGDYEAPLASVMKPRILTARVVFSFPMLIIFSIIYLCFSAYFVFKCQPIRKYTSQSVICSRSVESLY